MSEYARSSSKESVDLVAGPVVVIVERVNLYISNRLCNTNAKKCIICGEESSYRIKDNADFYCEECATDNFGDISYLEKIEEEQLKE